MRLLHVLLAAFVAAALAASLAEPHADGAGRRDPQPAARRNAVRQLDPAFLPGRTRTDLERRREPPLEHGNLDAKQAVDLWLASPPHREILLAPDWRQIGIGVVEAQQAPGAYGGQDVLVAAAGFGTRS